MSCVQSFLYFIVHTGLGEDLKGSPEGNKASQPEDHFDGEVRGFPSGEFSSGYASEDFSSGGGFREDSGVVLEDDFMHSVGAQKRIALKLGL